MTNEQMFILIAAPIIFNFGITALFFMLINQNINNRFSDIQDRFSDLHKRIDDLMKYKEKSNA